MQPCYEDPVVSPMSFASQGTPYRCQNVEEMSWTQLGEDHPAFSNVQNGSLEDGGEEELNTVLRTASQGPPQKAHKPTEHASALLRLPAELREKIYSFALVQEARISITENDHKQPPLLQVCHQLRKEGISIYYQENTFALPIHDLIVAPYPKHRVWTSSPILLYLGSRSWSNLKAWLKLYWEGVTDGIGPMVAGDLCILDKSFELLDELLKTEVAWVVADRALEVLRRAVEAAGETGRVFDP